MKRLLLVNLIQVLLLSSAAFLARAQVASETVILEATKTEETSPLPLAQMGGKSPSGHTLAVNSQYLMLDGKPWLPVMGEFHYSRYPEQYWEEELLKMKAGGIQIVATYVFWIHHEEVRGHFDWSGQRNLHRFVELCQKHGLYVFLRVGPYAHGEVRNGGLPDWVLNAGPTRTNDPQYLSFVLTYYGQIGQQVTGFFWKDGGPIIDVQLENEYSKRGPEAGEAHILELKKLAREAGLDAPLYTVTGWDNAVYPAREVIPVFGGYVDNFWDSSLDQLPPAGYYLFERSPSGGETAEDTTANSYPLLMAEAGGGMQVAYHRRPVISGDDVAAMTLTRLGSGVNLYGYYMYQGGANPEGKLTTLQESIEKDGIYDLPQVSYDFQAPLGQFGQMNPSFRPTKLLHLFLNDFGSDLAPMRTVTARAIPASPEDRSTLRVAARIRGRHGFVFVNNHQRLYPLRAHPAVQIRLTLPAETMVFPRKPVPISSGAYFIWPVNLDVNGALLKYATAQLLTRIQNNDVAYYFFFAQPGIAPEFAFDESAPASIHAARASISRNHSLTVVDGILPGLRVAIEVRSSTGKTTRIVVLSREQALNAWKFSLNGQDHMVLSPSEVFADEESLYLHARVVSDLHFAVFPASLPFKAGVPIKKGKREGIFTGYKAAAKPKSIRVRWEKVREALPSKSVQSGRYNAMAPKNADFDRAATWRLAVPDGALDGLSDAFLRIDYIGDVAHLVAGQRLLDDDFYKGTPWEIGLKRFLGKAPGLTLMLEVMPLRTDAPIYIPGRKRMAEGKEIANVNAIAIHPEYGVHVEFPKPNHQQPSNP